jgi:TM2 domain-containing membrane protein YozV
MLGLSLILMGMVNPLIALIPLFGIIFGIMGLKSTRKNKAITGIILCLIGLGTLIYIYSIVPWS